MKVRACWLIMEMTEPIPEGDEELPEEMKRAVPAVNAFTGEHDGMLRIARVSVDPRDRRRVRLDLDLSDHAMGAASVQSEPRTDSEPEG